MSNIEGVIYHVVNPFNYNQDKNSQDVYLDNYNNSYYKFIESLMFENSREFIKECDSYTYVINCKTDDVINSEDNYEYKFLKSKFMKSKGHKILQVLTNYYKNQNILIKKFNFFDDKIYLTLTYNI